MPLQSGPSLDMATMDLDGTNDNVLKFIKEPDSIQFSGLYDAPGQSKLINVYPSTLEEYFTEPTDILKEYLDGEKYDGSNLKHLVNKVENKVANIINDGSVYGQIFKSSVADVEKALKITSNYKNITNLDKKIYELSKIIVKSGNNKA